MKKTTTKIAFIVNNIKTELKVWHGRMDAKISTLPYFPHYYLYPHGCTDVT